MGKWLLSTTFNKSEKGRKGDDTANLENHRQPVMAGSSRLLFSFFSARFVRAFYFPQNASNHSSRRFPA
jgi:hypothetical protein